MNAIRIGSLSQYAGVRLQLSMRNEALEIIMGLLAPDNADDVKSKTPSLIGVGEVKLFLSFPDDVAPWVTRFSSRSAPGRRMMGSGERGVSIC